MFVPLNPDINFLVVLYYLESIELLLKQSFMCYSNVLSLAESAITQIADQASCRPFPQLIKGISRVFKKLLRYFNRTISTSLMLSYLESVMLLFKSSLWSCHKLPDVFAEFFAVFY